MLMQLLVDLTPLGEIMADCKYLLRVRRPLHMLISINSPIRSTAVQDVDCLARVQVQQRDLDCCSYAFWSVFLNVFWLVSFSSDVASTVPNVFMRPKNAAKEADIARAQFTHPDGALDQGVLVEKIADCLVHRRPFDAPERLPRLQVK